MLGFAFIYGAGWVSSVLLPWFGILSAIAIGLTIFVILPLAIPRATRSFASVALFIASYVFGITLWMHGLLLTLVLWGPFAVFVGLFMAGVGVIPIAMLASVFNGMWAEFWGLVLTLIMTFAARAGSMSLAESIDPTHR